MQIFKSIAEIHERLSPHSLVCGDCLEVLKLLPDNSVDALITDPPYGLSNHKPEEVRACLTAWLNEEVYIPKGKGFMSQSWDAWVPGPEVWKECFRVVKPGGHALVFTGTRSIDLMGMALRLAGWIPLDFLSWCHGQGFPKSTNISIAIDKKLGQEREVIGEVQRGSVEKAKNKGAGYLSDPANRNNQKQFGYGTEPITLPASPEAEQWDGWGTALKPAHEDILLLKKPHKSTVAENVLEWGTGGLNIDGCRIEYKSEEDKVKAVPGTLNHQQTSSFVTLTTLKKIKDNWVQPSGRFPANLLHDGSEEVVRLFPQNKPTKPHKVQSKIDKYAGYGSITHKTGEIVNYEEGPEALSTARFFQECPPDKPRLVYTSKASKKERGESNNHPTVKPLSLMRYLCKLITPPEGLILDPFMGSGTTGKAALLEGLDFLGVEINEEYFKLAQQRIKTTFPPVLKIKWRLLP